jgi:hypothetical protein
MKSGMTRRWRCFLDGVSPQIAWISEGERDEQLSATRPERDEKVIATKK